MNAHAERGVCTCRRSHGRCWTLQQTMTLEALWGRKPINAIARELGRTPWAVEVMARRLRLRQRDAGWGVPALAELFGVDRSTVRRWIKAGQLKGRAAFIDSRGDREYLVAEEDLQAFLRDWPHLFDAGRMSDDTYHAEHWVTLPQAFLEHGAPHPSTVMRWCREGRVPEHRRRGIYYVVPVSICASLHERAKHPCAIDEWARHAYQQYRIRGNIRKTRKKELVAA